ncbi:hypothetical protein HaLaN_21951, partial [Haematococcus lacustris]
MVELWHCPPVGNTRPAYVGHFPRGHRNLSIFAKSKSLIEATFRNGSAKEAKESRRIAHNSQDEVAARTSQQQTGPNTPPSIRHQR